MVIKYAILGFISWRPYTGYELKKIFADKLNAEIVISMIEGWHIRARNCSILCAMYHSNEANGKELIKAL